MADDTRKEYSREDAIEQGRADAKANAKKEQGPQGPTRDDAVKEGQDQAERNHKADQAGQDRVETDSNELKNDTSKAAKVRTAKSQLDPTGEDPISNKEVERSAVAGSTVKGETSVSNQDAADRAEESNKVAFDENQEQGSEDRNEETENEVDDIVQNAVDAKDKEDESNSSADNK